MKIRPLVLLLFCAASITSLHAQSLPDSNPIQTREKVPTAGLRDVVKALTSQGFFVCVESGFLSPNEKVLAVPLNGDTEQLLALSESAFGLTHQKNGDVIRLFDPSLKAIKSGYALDATIDELKIDGLTFGEAVRLIAEKYNLHLVPVRTGKPGESPPVSLELRNVTVRQALTQIFKAAGLKSWKASAVRSTVKGQERIVVIVIR